MDKPWADVSKEFRILPLYITSGRSVAIKLRFFEPNKEDRANVEATSPDPDPSSSMSKSDDSMVDGISDGSN